MKTKNSIFNWATLAIVFAIISLSACKPETPSTPEVKCDTTGHFQRYEGAGGFYSDYLIVLGNGTLLYPCIVNQNTIPLNEIYDGMPITLSYKNLSEEDVLCQMGNTPIETADIAAGGCTLAPEKVRITCIGVYIQRQKGGKTNGGWCGTK